MEWHWVLMDGAGAAIAVPDIAAPYQRFPSQSEAETWLGEMWPQLRDAGVTAVTLREGARVVYGPMSLHP